MTSDEIRKLAKRFYPEDGCFVCNHEVLKPVLKALNAYADTLDRCEKVKAKAREENATQTSLGCKSCVENFVKHVEFIETGVEK